MSDIPSIGQAAFDYQFSIMQAIKDGLAVQYRPKGANIWQEKKPVGSRFTHLNFSDFEFRIKPQAREVYINEYADGEFGVAYSSFSKAADVGEFSSAYRGTRKFVEVVD